MNSFEGSGAAGGLGAGCIYFLNGKLEAGIETILKLNNFKEEIKDADLIITGEGKLDNQSFDGKAISGITKEANGKEIIIICGINECEADLEGIKIYETSEGISIKESLESPQKHLRNTIKKMIKDLKM